MKQKNRFQRKIFSVVLTLAMVIGLMPQLAMPSYAATDTYANLIPTGQEDETALNAKKVNFNGKTWFIIADNSTSDDAGTVTLLAADTSFGTAHFARVGGTYAQSDIRAGLKELTESGSFKDVAKAIVETDNGKLYLLSSGEAQNLPDNVLCLMFTGGSTGLDGYWWLRDNQNNLYDYIWAVKSFGERPTFDGWKYDKIYGVRPALQLDLTKVVYNPETKSFRLKGPTVLIDVGKGHESLFTEDVLNDIKEKFGLKSASIEGSVITLEDVKADYTEFELWEIIPLYFYDMLEADGYIHSGEKFWTIGYKPIDDYDTAEEVEKDVFSDARETTLVSDNLTYYMLWGKPYEKLEIDNGKPTCGKSTTDAFPTVPEGFTLDKEASYWMDENDQKVDKFEGGKEYTFVGKIHYHIDGALWRYYINPDNFTLIVDGKKVDAAIYNGFQNDFQIDFSFKATVDHDWGEGEVTTPASCTEKGEKTFKCKVEGCEATKTEEIAALGHNMTKTDEVAATCTEDGTKAYWTCGTCKKKFADEKGEGEISNPEVIKAIGHDWNEPEYTWAGDNSTVTATHICNNDGTHKETETATVKSEVTKKAACTEKGETTYTSTAFKNNAFAIQKKTITDIPATGHKYGEWKKLDDKQHQRVCEHDKTHVEKANHSWDAGKVTKESTTEAEGIKTYTCTVCKATRTESIPKLDPKPEPSPEPTPTPDKSTVKPVLVAKGIAKGKKAVNISWNKIKDADRYEIYFSKCNYKGKYTMKKIKTVNGKTLKWTKKGLKKKTAYKFYVKALKKSGKNYKMIAKSKTAHFLTGNVRGKLTNPKSLKLKKSKITLKKGKSATIKGTVTKVKKSKKLATAHAAKLRFTSNNPSVAKVNAKGKVTAKKAGTATVYVQTINGIWKTCKITVK